MSNVKENTHRFESVRPKWNDVREASVFAGIKRKKRRRTVVRLSGVSLFVLAFVALFASLSRESGVSLENEFVNTGKEVPIIAARPDDILTPITMKDGSTATPLDEQSQLVVESMTNTHTAIRIMEGGGRFNVVPSSERVFEVLINGITVSVLGTAFDVRKLDAQALVSVSKGHVRVRWPGGEDDLFAGQKDTYPRQGSSQSSDMKKTVAPPPADSRPSKKRERTAEWRALAKNGDFSKASSLLLKRPEVQDTVDDLLLAADAMRLSRKPKKALPYLDRIAKDHSSDPRVSLSELTRGRILLNQLNRPFDAAAAFANVRKFSPKSSLAQDALAREVEALYRAGNTALAKQRAKEYVSKYPKGRRLDSVIRFGNLNLSAPK